MRDLRPMLMCRSPLLRSRLGLTIANGATFPFISEEGSPRFEK